jgi:hypothetical protein
MNKFENLRKKKVIGSSGKESLTSSKAFSSKNKTKSGSKNKRPSINFLSWVVVFLCCCVYGLVLGFKYNEFSKLAADVEQQLAGLNYDRREVLGIENNSSDTGPVGEVENEQVELEVDSSNELVAQENDERDSESDVGLVVDDIEAERKQKLREDLKLQLPTEIDNPNFPVTFVNPGDEPVEIQIDGEGFEEVESPFLLPSLSIGLHKINFRFQDEDEITQNFEETIIIIPRPPELVSGYKDEFRSDEALAFSGTALPNSEVVVVIGNKLHTTRSEVDSEGNWTVEFDEELSKGEHTLIAMTRKLGYSSDFSQQYSFSVGTVAGEVSTEGLNDEDQNTEFDLRNLITEDNYQCVISGFALFSVILLLAVTFLSRKLSKKSKENIDLMGAIANGGKSKDNPDSTQKLSLREKFARSGLSKTAKLKKNEDKEKDKKKNRGDKKEDSDKKDKDKKDGGGKRDSAKTNVGGKKGTDRKDGKGRRDSAKTNAGGKKDSGKKDGSDKDRHKKDSSKADSGNKKDSEEKDSGRQDRNKKASGKSGILKLDKKDKKKTKPVPGKIYKKSDFLQKFKNQVEKDSNNISITLTSNSDSEKTDPDNTDKDFDNGDK